MVLLSLIAYAAYAQEDSVATAEYSVVIDVRGRQITGICMINTATDGSAVGTIVNEFGIRAFDFTFDGQKATVQNVFPPINKWYIRRVLNRDMAFLLTNMHTNTTVEKGKRTITVSPSGDITLTNRKYKISYTFKPLDDKQ